jgi:GNAT superfamily N-acetyltransferase
VSPTEPVIRALRAEELPQVFPIVKELREHLDSAEFMRRVRRQSDFGYTLYAAFDDAGTLLGALGMRPLASLSRGEHLHIDDLVVTESERGRGVGAALLRFAERWAAENGLEAVFLDSRPGVEPFYAARGYEARSATIMRKLLT